MTERGDLELRRKEDQKLQKEGREPQKEDDLEVERGDLERLKEDLELQKEGDLVHQKGEGLEVQKEDLEPQKGGDLVLNQDHPKMLYITIIVHDLDQGQGHQKENNEDGLALDHAVVIQELLL